jgi:hypothetical protein
MSSEICLKAIKLNGEICMQLISIKDRVEAFRNPIFRDEMVERVYQRVHSPFEPEISSVFPLFFTG